MKPAGLGLAGPEILDMLLGLVEPLGPTGPRGKPSGARLAMWRRILLARASRQDIRDLLGLEVERSGATNPILLIKSIDPVK